MAIEVVLAGAGPMAEAYASVLNALGVRTLAFCRSPESAERFAKATGVACVPGGVKALQAFDLNASIKAIVAVPVEHLGATTGELINIGIKEVLVEKPAAPDLDSVCALAAYVKDADAQAFVAYNRRYYASVQKLRELAEEDGGIVSLDFEFTELSDRVGALANPRSVMEHWEIANSTHVIDTAFFLAGMPKEIVGMRSGALDWHPSASRYVGHGITHSGVLFSYRADWDAPGRWGIEANTRHRKFILRPMEKLAIQRRNAFSLEPFELDDVFDLNFKPGIYRQVEAFLGRSNQNNLLTLADHAAQLRTMDEAIFTAPKF